MKITDKRISDVGKSIKTEDIPYGTYFTGCNDSMSMSENEIHLRYYDGILVVNDPECNWSL